MIAVTRRTAGRRGATRLGPETQTGLLALRAAMTRVRPARTTVGRTPLLPRFAVVLLVIDLAIAAASAVNHLLANRLGIEPPTFLRLGQESNLPTWYSSAQHAAVAVLFGLLAWRDLRADTNHGVSWSKRRGLPLLMVVGIFGLFSLDETAMIHERIGAVVAARTNLNDQHGLATGPAMIVCLPLALGAVFVACRSTRSYWQGRPCVAGLFLAGVGLFLFSAGVMELLVDLVAHNVTLVKLETLFEETGEMIGTTMVLASALHLLAAEKVELRFA